MTILENQSRDSSAVTAPRLATQANVTTLLSRLATPREAEPTPITTPWNEQLVNSREEPNQPTPQELEAQALRRHLAALEQTLDNLQEGRQQSGVNSRPATMSAPRYKAPTVPKPEQFTSRSHTQYLLWMESIRINLKAYPKITKQDEVEYTAA
jgi:hypothetical protein